MSGWRRVRVRLRHDPVRLGPVRPTARHGGWSTPDGIAALVELDVGTSLRADADVGHPHPPVRSPCAATARQVRSTNSVCSCIWW